MFINNSRIKELNTCQQRFAWKYLQGICENERLHFLLGTSIHEGLAVAQAHGIKAGLEKAIGIYEDVVKQTQDFQQFQLMETTDMDGFEAFGKDVVITGFLEAHQKLEEHGIKVVFTEAEFDVEHGQWHNDITAHFVDAAGTEHFRMPTYEEIAAGISSPHKYSEDVSCSCYRKHHIIGRIDGLALYNGAYYILDYKTHARNDNNYWDQYIIDSQFSIYLHIAEKQLQAQMPGLKLAGICIVGIYKPSTSQVAAWNNRTKDPVNRKSMSDYMAGKGSVHFYPRTNEQLNVALRAVESKANEMERRIATNDFPPALHSTACTGFGRCQFFDVCLGGHSGPIDILEHTNFKIRQEQDYVQIAEAVHTGIQTETMQDM